MYHTAMSEVCLVYAWTVLVLKSLGLLVVVYICMPCIIHDHRHVYTDADMHICSDVYINTFRDVYTHARTHVRTHI